MTKKNVGTSSIVSKVPISIPNRTEAPISF